MLYYQAQHYRTMHYNKLSGKKENHFQRNIFELFATLFSLRETYSIILHHDSFFAYHLSEI